MTVTGHLDSVWSGCLGSGRNLLLVLSLVGRLRLRRNGRVGGERIRAEEARVGDVDIGESERFKVEILEALFHVGRVG